MKKLLSVVFAFVLIFSCFAVCAFAEDEFVLTEDITHTEVYTISEDYLKLYVDGEPCSRIDASMLTVDFAYDGKWVDLRDNVYYEATIKLTETQKKNVKEISVSPDFEMYVLFQVKITYNDGSVLTAIYIKDSHLDEYNKIVNGECEKYIIDFAYPIGNYVQAEKSAMFGEGIVINDKQLSTLDVYDVSVQSSDGSLTAITGYLFVDSDSYYYLDAKENSIEAGMDWYYYENVEYTLHKITDTELVADLKLALEKYYGDDYNVLYDDNTTDTISAVFLIFVFAVVPFVIFVIFLVKAIRGKGIYKKLYGAVSAVCIAEIIVFVILAFILTSAKPSDDTVIGGSDDAGYIQIETDIDFDNEDLYL